MKKKIVIQGAGNIGMALAHGIRSNKLSQGKVMLIRGRDIFTKTEEKVFDCSWDSSEVNEQADIIIVAVQPGQFDEVMKEITDWILSLKEGREKHKQPEQILISLVAGKSISDIEKHFMNAAVKENYHKELEAGVPIVRVMPNTALRVGSSMTCLAFNKYGKKFQEEVEIIFKTLGETLIIDEKMFPQATVLGASGIALVARFIRGYMQAGIQHGFNEHDALSIATQVMIGAAMLIQEGTHPELVIDKVTTPNGCTIAALAEMDHGGLVSALLKTIEVGIIRAKGL